MLLGYVSLLTPLLAQGADSPLGPTLQALVAGLAASLACGLGVVPLMVRGLDPSKHTGIGYGLAGGLMTSASVYNLILPGMHRGQAGWQLQDVAPVILGILLGALFLSMVDRYLHDYEDRQAELLARSPSMKAPKRSNLWGGRVGLLVFLAMTVHSIPEGVAVGVGYTSDAVGALSGSHGGHGVQANMGPTLALAIAIHNIPEGLAVAIPMRTVGASYSRCFLAAVFTSLPQPIASVPAVLLAWFFEPLMPVMMGFAAGAMIFLVVLELIPEALHSEKPKKIAWSFIFGFCGMLLIQVIL